MSAALPIAIAIGVAAYAMSRKPSNDNGGGGGGDDSPVDGEDPRTREPIGGDTTTPEHLRETGETEAETEAERVAREAERVIRESDEIIKGERDAQPDPKPPAPKPVGMLGKYPANMVGTVLVSDVQKLCRAYGAPSKGLTDGLYGPQTAACYQHLAKSKKVPAEIERVDGTHARVLKGSWDSLTRGVPKPAPGPKPAPAPAPKPEPLRTAPVGTKPAEQASTPMMKKYGLANLETVLVSDVQKLAIAYGAPSAGLTDGLWGPKTSAAYTKIATAKKQYPEIERVDGTHARVVRPAWKTLRDQQPKPKTSSPAPASSSAPHPTPSPAPAGGATPPPGFDRQKAASTAKNLAQHITKSGATNEERKRNYSRPTLRQWQKLAGIAQDGIYGPGSAAALKYYLGNAPAALYAGKVTTYPWA